MLLNELAPPTNQQEFRENDKVKIISGAFSGEVGDLVSYNKYKKQIDNVATLAGMKFNPQRDLAVMDHELGKIRIADRNIVKKI